MAETELAGAELAEAELAGATLPGSLVFVDLETTGGTVALHRVTEIGIVRMEDGTVTEEWSSLVNPECRIPSYIEAFTGITNEMVATAPRFADIAPLVLDKLGRSPRETPVFVAHNARFDYSFLRAEFGRAGVKFSAPVLCTVKLSRRLYPEHARHNLDAIMARHGLTCSARHRALGDARVLRDFWHALRGEVPEHVLAGAARGVIGTSRLPEYLPPELESDLPDGPGAYRFFDAEGALLYVGRAHALRSAVLRHFAGGRDDAARTRRIDWVEAGELGARLQEARWLRAAPNVQRRPKRRDEVTVRYRVDAPMEFVDLGEVAAGAPMADCHGLFHSAKEARRALLAIAGAHSLCLQALGLEDCRCQGGCVGKEALHDTRVRVALSALAFKPWPFPGRIALKEGAAHHVFEHWAYLGTALCEAELHELAAAALPRTVDGAGGGFNADLYRTLVRYLAQHPQVEWHALPAPPAQSNGDDEF